MIKQFEADTGLLVIDAQVGVNDHGHWGGSCGHRNNPHSEERIAELLAAWRSAARPILFTLHNSREPVSPLKLSLPSGQPMPGLEPQPGEAVILKDVNSGFAGTSLELELRRRGVGRLVVCGYFTNMCVETTVRAAGNDGYDTYLVHDACAAGNRIGHDGRDWPADEVHAMSVANMHGEFCTALETRDALALLAGPALHLQRVQGNEPTRHATYPRAA